MQTPAASLVGVLVVLSSMAVAPVAFTEPYPAASTATEVDSCRVIDEPGRYVLTRNIDVEEGLKPHCIHITVNDVTFDGNGHVIEGNYTRRKDYAEHDALAAESNGILVAGDASLSEVVVRNVAVEDWKFGVNFTDVTNSRVVGVTATKNRVRGVYLDDFDGGTVTATTVTGTHGTALVVRGDANVVHNSTLSDNDLMAVEAFAQGLLVNGTNNTVAGNDLRNNAEAGLVVGTGSTVVSNTVASSRLVVDGTDAQIADNTLTDSALFVEGNATTVEYNTVEGSTLGVSGDRVRVATNRLGDSTITVGGETLTDSTIAENSFQNSSVVMNEDGLLESVPVTNLTIADNTIEDGGITLGRAPNSTVRHNTVEGSEAGLRLVGPLDNTVVEGNVLVNNSDGIHVGTWSTLVVRHNDIRNNGDGIHIAFSRFKEYDPPSDTSDSACPENRTGRPLSISIYDNNLADNDAFGVHNTANSTVNATNNYWGASDGPSSTETDEDAPFEDPWTGTLANGGGSAVSEGPDAGVSNVHFDPVLTEGGCKSCT